MRLPFLVPLNLSFPVAFFFCCDSTRWDVDVCRFLGRATPEQRDGYHRARMGATRTVPAQATQATSVKPQSRPKYDWEVAGGFTALNNHELGALLSVAGQVPKKQPRQDRFGEKTLENRRQQLQTVIKKLMDQEASEQRRLAKRKRQEEAQRRHEQSPWARQQAAKSPVAWACNDKLCGHFGPGCQGWREKQREDALAAAAAVEETDAEFGDDSFLTDFDPDQAIAAASTESLAGGAGASRHSAAQEPIYT